MTNVDAMERGETERALEGLARYAVAGVAGGAIVYVVETVDRLATLWPSFNSAAEAALYAVYLSPVLLIGLLAGIVLGMALTIAGTLRRVATTALVRRHAPGAATLGALVAVAAITAVCATVSALAPGLVEEPLFRVAQKVSGRLVRIPFVIRNFGPMLVAGFALAAGALVAADWALATRPSGRGRAAAAAAGVALVGVMLGLYAVDSRLYYGRYEFTMHLPAQAVVLACAVFAAGFFAAALRLDARRRRVALAATVLAGLGTVGFAFSVAHIGANENLNTLLWRRSVVARRAYQALAVATDRDGDGFSGLFDGDLDDSDPGVHPLASEVAGNGVDDNCIGGDGAPPEIAPVGLEPPAPVAPGTARNLLFISIDTLRANRMSVYGYGRPTTPRLDEYAKLGVLAERAYSQGSNTGNSFASMQRSATRGAIFDASRPTMFGRLAEAGFTTAFLNARRDDVWLETKRWVKYRRIILDGVATIDHTGGEQLWDADRVTDRAIEYLASLPESTRHATWVHYLDPHEPRKKMAPYDWGNSASDKYDTEVAYSDLHVGRLLDWMRESGRLNDTLVVLVADHGESFQDHGMDLHGNRPYDEQISVPFMLWAPDVAPARIAEPVALLDVAPTVLSYFGLEPIPAAEGRDLRTPLRPMPVFSETPLNLVEVAFFAFGVTDGDWRYIWDVRGDTVELYNLRDDPGELHNLADAMPERAAEMRAILARWLDTTRSVRNMRDA